MTSLDVLDWKCFLSHDVLGGDEVFPICPRDVTRRRARILTFRTARVGEARLKKNIKVSGCLDLSANLLYEKFGSNINSLAGKGLISLAVALPQFQLCSFNI